MIMVVVIMNMVAEAAVAVVMMITTIIIMMMNTRARHGVGGRDELNLLKIITEYRYIVLILFGLQTFLNIWLISGWRRKRTVPIDGVFDTPLGTVSTNLNFGKLGIVCK